MHQLQASIAQLGERQTEDLKVPRSIRGRGIFWLSRTKFWQSGKKGSLTG